MATPRTLKQPFASNRARLKRKSVRRIRRSAICHSSQRLPRRGFAIYFDTSRMERLQEVHLLLHNMEKVVFCFLVSWQCTHCALMFYVVIFTNTNCGWAGGWQRCVYSCSESEKLHARDRVLGVSPCILSLAFCELSAFIVGHHLQENSCFLNVSWMFLEWIDFDGSFSFWNRLCFLWFRYVAGWLTAIATKFNLRGSTQTREHSVRPGLRSSSTHWKKAEGQ